MQTRKIYFTKLNTAELLTVETPPLTPGKVLVKTGVSTISSGTERALITGDLNVNSLKPPAAEPGFPRHSGYSSSGVVLEVGEGVEGVQPGDRVAMAWSYHTEYQVIAARNVVPLGDCSFKEGALWNIGTFPLAAIRKCRLEMGESAVVMGMGILGQMAVVLLRLAGAVPVIAVDPIPEKRDKALSLGADFALDPNEPDFAQRVKELTGGGAKVAIEVTGFGKALDQVLDAMAWHGRVALLGCTRNSDFSIDYYRKVHGPGISLIGAHTQARPGTDSSPGYWTTRDDMLTLRALAERGRVSLADLVEETWSPQEAPRVYTRLATEKAFPLVQFDWRKLL